VNKFCIVLLAGPGLEMALFSSNRLYSRAIGSKADFLHRAVKIKDGNGYPSPVYPAGKNPIGIRVWDKKIPMGM
jgi:hypothetical protein